MPTTSAKTGNLFSDIFSGAITLFHEAEAVIDGVWSKLTGAKPGTATSAIDAEAAVVIENVKQQASNAIAIAQTEVSDHFGNATSMVESAVDTFVMGITGGAAAPVVPGLNAIMSLGADVLHGALDHAFAAARAKLPSATNTGTQTNTGTVSSSGTAQTVGTIGV